MVWWVICFVAVVLTIFAKWYFATTVERMRVLLVRHQREVLELKGQISDLRQDAKGRARIVQEREAGIKRVRSNIAQLQGEIKGLEDDPKPQDPKPRDKE